MTDPAILFVKPEAISARDKKSLRDAGVIVIEIENPQDAKFVRAAAELDGGEILKAAARAITESGMALTAREAFGRALCEAIKMKK